jgi:glycosyltransferase involved in cell wall biosynthesis
VLRRRLRRSRKGAPRVLLIIENISIARDHRAQKQLKSLLAGGYRVGLICRRDENNGRFRQSGLDLYEYPAPPEGDGVAVVAFEYGYSVLAAVVLVLRALADGPVHAIQVGQPPDVYFVPAFLGKLFGTRFIVDQRDLSPEVFEARFGKSNGVLPRTLRLFERASWRTADHVFTVNGSLVGVVTERGGVSPKHVTAVMNGPLLSAVARGNADEELREGFAHLVCWHGVMGPQDHVEHALQAISHFTHHLGRRDALFVFMGDGVAETGLRQMATELGLDEVVRFTGWLAEDACFTYIATADLGLDTNLQPEVTPVKAMEYMGHGVPLVTFDVHETRLLAGEAARYVEAGDAEEMAREIARLLDTPDERRRMGDIGRERIEQQFAWDRQEERYLEIFGRFLDGKRRSSAEATVRSES